MTEYQARQLASLTRQVSQSEIKKQMDKQSTSEPILFADSLRTARNRSIHHLYARIKDICLAHANGGKSDASFKTGTDLHSTIQSHRQIVEWLKEGGLGVAHSTEGIILSWY